MKLTYSTMIDGVVEEYIFEGPIGDVLVAWSALFNFEDPDEPESCSITGRSCDTCKHQGACYGCGAHYAHWEPAGAEQQERCPKCGGVADGVCKCEPEPVQLKETHLEETNSARRCLVCGDMTKYRIVGTDDYFCTVCA